MSGTHENLEREDKEVPSSDRSFGFVFCGFFVIIGLLPLLFGSLNIRWWSLGLALVFAVLALAAPSVLHPLNRLWLAFGRLLHKVVSPVMMGFLFYVTVAPMGIVMRLLGKDPLRLNFDRSASSYWIVRRPPGPPPETMRDQF